MSAEVAACLPSSSAMQAAGASRSSGEAAAQQADAARAALADAVQALDKHNRQLVGQAAAVSDAVGDIAVAQCIKSEVVASGLWQTFSPKVLADLKRNADQLQELKQQAAANTQSGKDSSKRLMQWMTGALPGGGGGGGAGELERATGSSKRRVFPPFQLGGSSIAGKATPASSPAAASPSRQPAPAGALKFWQVGVLAAGRPFPSRRRGSSTPAGSEQAPAKGLSALLFGRARRTSTDGATGTASAGSRRVSVDPAASWRSSQDGSAGGRRTSQRSSEGGGGARGMMPLAASPPSAAAAAAAAEEEDRSAMLDSLAAGEGPLSRRHSALAVRPGPQAAEQMAGAALECVAEDEREGRDSPAPSGEHGAPRIARAGHLGLAPLRVPRSATMHIMRHLPGASPVTEAQSFSFGNRGDEEPHSPSFLRASVSSRAVQPPVAGVSGPLVRSSLALRTNMATAGRVDPFEALEPEPQPFVEQLRAQELEAAAAAPGLVAALRRSISGAGARGALQQQGRWEGDLGSRNTSRHVSDAGTGGQLSALGQQQQQQYPQAVGEVALLDLGATRAYAMGVHQVMMGLEATMLSAQSASEASSLPTTPGSQQGAPDEQMAAAGAGPEQQQQQRANGAALPSPRAAHESTMPQQGHRQASPRGVMAGAAARLLLQEPSDAGSAGAGMPPLQSGMQSPAGSRYPQVPGGAAVRPLPLMGQACMQMLDRQPSSGMLPARQQPLATSTSVSLAEVYQQTSGNLAPLSSGLTSARRPSSGSGSRAPPPGAGVRPSQTDAGPAGYGPLLGQQQGMRRPGGQPAAGRWTPTTGNVLDPATAAAAGSNNKYASHWGLDGGLSRQNSGGMSRAASQRNTPRQSITDQLAGTWPQQQQQQRRAVGPVGGAAPATQQQAFDRRRQQQLAAEQAAQQPAERPSDPGSEDYASADEALSSGASAVSAAGTSRHASSSGGPASSSRQAAVAAAAAAFVSSRPTTSAQAAVASQWSPNKNVAAIAQAPVNAREVVMLDSLAPEASGLSNPGRATGGGSGGGAVSHPLSYPLSAGVSPRDGGGAGAGAITVAAAGGPSRWGSRAMMSRTPSTAAAAILHTGSRNIYEPLEPPKPRLRSQPSPYQQQVQQAPYSPQQQHQQLPQQHYQQHQQHQQQPQLLTAVDIARQQRSGMRRASGNGGSSQRGSDFGAGGGGMYGRAGPFSNNGLGYGSSSGYGSAWGSVASSRAPSGVLGPMASGSVARQMSQRQASLYTR